MRPEKLFQQFDIDILFDTILPDFILAFAFFTSVAYAVLGKHFGQQRPAITMSAVIGFALSTGLVWWERRMNLSIKNLGPIAVGFAIIILAFVMYQAIQRMGGSWAGAGIALGASILIAKLLEINVPIDPDIIQTIMIVALIVGILAFLLHHRGNIPQVRYSRPKIADTRHDMSDLYRDRRVSNQITKKLKKIRHNAKTLDEHPQEAPNIMQQLKRILPAEGWLTERMAQLRAKAHQVRKGHIARLDETRDVFAKLPVSVKKKSAADLADRYRQIIGIDTRLERLDKAVAENEKRIRELTYQAQQYTAKHDYPKQSACLKAAEKLQHHNSKLLKTINRTEGKLSAIIKKIAQQTEKVTNNEKAK